MFYNWLDRWDEQRAQQGEDGKEVANLVLGAEHGFPGIEQVDSIEKFCAVAERAAKDPDFFEPINVDDLNVEKDEDWVKFPSEISTEIDENNVVWAKVTESGSSNRALVIFHHWNATKRNRKIADFFSRRGITVVEIALPYHLERSRPGAKNADYFVSPNLGRTIQSMKQGVLDGRKLIRYLKGEGYSEISVLGISLGSWIAGLVAAHDPTVTKAALFLSAGSAADIVWTGRATRAIRDSLEPEMDLSELRRAWSPMNLGNYAQKFSRPNLDVSFVLAKRDKVVLPEISERFLHELKKAGVMPKILELNCGHYSLAKLPYNILAGLSLKRMLDRGH